RKPKSHQEWIRNEIEKIEDAEHSFVWPSIEDDHPNRNQFADSRSSSRSRSSEYGKHNALEDDVPYEMPSIWVTTAAEEAIAAASTSAHPQESTLEKARRLQLEFDEKKQKTMDVHADAETASQIAQDRELAEKIHRMEQEGLFNILD
ncbi:MAG: hypothetical protein SGCHY_005287, partial [Lobulomycetales sp.]